MRHSPNSHSCSQQFAHVYQGLLASVSPPPPCLCSQKEAAAGHLKCMRRKHTWFRLTATGLLCFSVLFIYGQQYVTYSLVRVGADESKQLPQQDTVGGLVPAVLDGQWLQKGKGAAPVAGPMAPPMEKKTVGSEKQETLRECVFFLIEKHSTACGNPTLVISHLPLICSSKFQIFITNHFQVRRSRHATKKNRLPHSMRYHLCFRSWFTSWNREE